MRGMQTYDAIIQDKKYIKIIPINYEKSELCEYSRSEYSTHKREKCYCSFEFH